MEHLDPITAPEIFGSVHRILQVNIIDVSGALSHVLEVQQGGDVAGDQGEDCEEKFQHVVPHLAVPDDPALDLLSCRDQQSGFYEVDDLGQGVETDPTPQRHEWAVDLAVLVTHQQQFFPLFPLATVQDQQGQQAQGQTAHIDRKVPYLLARSLIHHGRISLLDYGIDEDGSIEAAHQYQTYNKQVIIPGVGVPRIFAHVKPENIAHDDQEVHAVEIGLDRVEGVDSIPQTECNVDTEGGKHEDNGKEPPLKFPPVSFDLLVQFVAAATGGTHAHKHLECFAMIRALIQVAEGDWS